MKNFTLLLFCFFNLLTQSSYSQIKFIDLSQKQLRLLHELKNTPDSIRSKVFLDSLYHPHKQFWSGYAGEEKDFTDWMNKEGYHFLDFFDKRNREIDGQLLLKKFNEVQASMQKLTGYTASGKWYFVFSHAATDLGGLSSGEMVLDLSHQNNSSTEKIELIMPHEINHLICSKLSRFDEGDALSFALSEGFAVFINEVYWGNKYTTAQHLGYTEAEYQLCEKNREFIRQFFDEFKFSKDPKIINYFRNAGLSIRYDLPPKIGYYIGYNIIKNFAKNHDWRDIYKLKSSEILAQSKF